MSGDFTDFHQQWFQFNVCIMQTIVCSNPLPGSRWPVPHSSSLALSNGSTAPASSPTIPRLVFLLLALAILSYLQASDTPECLFPLSSLTQLPLFEPSLPVLSSLQTLKHFSKFCSSCLLPTMPRADLAVYAVAFICIALYCSLFAYVASLRPLRGLQLTSCAEVPSSWSGCSRNVC